MLIFTGSDPVGIPVLRLLRGRIAAYNMHLRAIADARDCYLVDLWSMRFLRDMSAWSADRLHLSPESHQRVALRAAEVLGIHGAGDWRVPAGDAGSGEAGAVETAVKTLAGAGTETGVLARPGVARAAWVAARREDARWAREYLLPWVNRRLHGTSSGDGLPAKRPSLQPVNPAL